MKSVSIKQPTSRTVIVGEQHSNYMLLPAVACAIIVPTLAPLPLAWYYYTKGQYDLSYVLCGLTAGAVLHNMLFKQTG